MSYQEEYYMANVDGPSPMKELSGTEVAHKLALRGLGMSEEQAIVDAFEAGKCPHCYSGLVEETDTCLRCGDVYETYLAAKVNLDGCEDVYETYLADKVNLNGLSYAEETDEVSRAVSGSHYNDVVPGYQYMQMMEHMLENKEGVEAHLLGQVYKYLMRSGKKDDVEQEYRKARWYLNCLVKYKQTGEVDPNNND